MAGHTTSVNAVRTLLAICATMLVAAPLAAQNGGRNDGGVAPPQFPPKVDPKHPPHPGPQRRPHRGDQMSSLIDYMEREDTIFPGDIDGPVTGYANEALWEPLDTKPPKTLLRR